MQYEDYHSLPTGRKILWSKALCEFCLCARKVSLKIIFISLVIVNGLREGRTVRDTLQRTSLHWQEVGSVCWSKDWKGKGYPAFSKFCGAPISLQHIYKDIGVDYFCTQVCALPVYVHSLYFIASARLLQHALKTKGCGLKCHCCWSVVCISALSLGFGDLKS